MTEKNAPAKESASDKRAKLREKVSDSRSRLSASRFPNATPPEGFRALAMDYPIALVAGGLVMGVVIGALLPRAPGRRLGKSAIAAASVASELGLAYAQKAIDRAGEATSLARSEGERVLGIVGDKLSDASTTAGELAGDAADSTRKKGLQLARQVVRLTSQLRH